jgi:hypothetical protein
MATISYYNTVLPIGGRSFNPGFEEVLDPTFTLGTAGSGVYEIVNNDGGPFQGFKVQFISNVNGSGNFSYVLTDTDELKPSGTIAVINLLAPNGTNIAQVMPGAAGFGDAKLEDFYARLTNPNAETSKDAILSALDNLFGKADVIYGTAVADHLTNFGYGTGQMNAGAGDDILTSRGSAGWQAKRATMCSVSRTGPTTSTAPTPTGAAARARRTLGFGGRPTAPPP